MAEFDEREEELSTLAAIYPELVIDTQDKFAASLELPVAPSTPLLIRFIPTRVAETVGDHTYATAAPNGAAYVERDIELAYLPSITLQVKLPNNYPAEAPPVVRLSTRYSWLPKQTLTELEQDVRKLWEEYGTCQILFAYIDHLQQAAERGFDFDQSSAGCLELPVTAESDLLSFDSETRRTIFNAGTWDCGICLEPKKGSACYQLKTCGHVFCKQCLQDFYNNAIKEGDVSSVKCLSPDCGKEEQPKPGKRKRKSKRTLRARVLLDMGVEEDIVRRYVEMKRKKKLEADKSTVYCPRTWCQGPAKSAKYAPIPADLSAYVAMEPGSDVESEVESEDHAAEQETKPVTNNKVPPNPTDRLAVCEKCSFAFCKVCYMGWHGPFARCFPRNPDELSAEEKASYDYIRLNTSPCAYCNSPTQKTMGCNHMACFNCGTHFCYLCSAWLSPDNPYAHFNKPGTGCYQRLWELEEGDEGQAPGDQRGFGGGRGWEQLAREAAREAEAQEAAAAAQAEEDERTRRNARLVEAPNPAAHADDIPIEVIMAQIALDEDHDPREAVVNNRRPRARNPFPARPRGQEAANAIRNHERRGRGNGPPARVVRPPDNDPDREQQEIQRFLAMAERDEEDGWDSDELGDDDERFIIH